jgi:uncharacterized repeat protein (TIGR03806 family)
MANGVRLRITLPCSVVVSVFGCGDGGSPSPAPTPVEVTPAPPGAPYETLSEWSLFIDGAAQTPAPRVVPYDVISPLFSDYTTKLRFMWIPEGTTIGFEPETAWRFPEGSILVKTFAYLKDERDPGLGRRLLETRLLVHEPGGFVSHTYVWNEEQTEALRMIAGTTLPSTWIDASGATRSNDYGVPNTNECQECHGEAPQTDTMGGLTRQLDRDFDYGSGAENQIDRLAALGWLDSAPPAAGERERLVDPFGSAPLLDRVRSYLDANCGHCHTEGGWASESALLLSWDLTDPSEPSANWGTCKVPTSAGGATCGLTYDVVPGDPDASIMICRVASTDNEVRMPPLATKLVHDEGVALVRDWIAGMPDEGCP